MARTTAESSARSPQKLDRDVVVTGLVIVSGLVMVVLDSTIVNVALDTLSRDLDTSLSSAQWVVTGYLLAVAMVIPLTGWAMDHFTPKRLWLASVSMFVVGSALCAASWSIESLVAFRIVQGLGGGMLMPAGQAFIARAAGPDRMGSAMAILGVPMLLGPVFGPVLGGLLVEYASWHWIFLVNVPVGALAVFLAATKLPAGGGDADDEGLDAPGLVLLGGSLAAVLYGLSSASSHGGFGHADVLGWLIAGGTGLLAYVGYSLWRGPRSIIDVRLLRDRLFASSTTTVFLVALALFGGMILLPLYFQVVRGEGALDAGLLLVPQGVGAAAAMVIAGKLSDRLGAGWVVPVGVVLAMLGTWPFTQLSDDTSYVLLMAALFVRGMGLGSIMMPAISSAYLRLSADRVTRATPALSAIQQIGASLGSAILVTTLTHHFTGQLASKGIEDEGSGSGAITGLPPAAMREAAPLLADSFGYAFWLAFILTALILIPALGLPRHRRTHDAEPARSRPGGPGPRSPQSG